MSNCCDRTSAASARTTDRALRDCLGHFVTGVVIVTYDGPDGPRGLTVNAFTSVSLDPPLVLVSLSRKSNAAKLVPSRAFAINVLRADQRELAVHFAGRGATEPDLHWTRVSGVSALTDCLARVVCAPWTSHDAGDHTIVLGRVIEFDSGDARPLCFFRGEFLSLHPPP